MGNDLDANQYSDGISIEVINTDADWFKESDLFLIFEVAAWDRTPTGLIMAAVTGISGPIVELLLLKGWPVLFGLELYHYSAPDFLGAIPLWIG